MLIVGFRKNFLPSLLSNIQTVERELMDMKRVACVLLILVLLTSLASAFAQEVVTDAALDPDAVKYLQIDLNAKGYMDGSADGVMGDATQKGIRRAQEDLGLPVTGYMTEQLNAALLKNAFPLEKESRNSYVYRMQTKLFSWGFLEEEPTGYFGQSTQDAVISFQKFTIDEVKERRQSELDETYGAMEVPEDVVVDMPLVDTDDYPCDGVLTRKWYDFLMEEYECPLITAKLDDDSVGVKLVQKRLHALGYLYSGFDGVFGSGTELALKYFQKKNGLPETGSCDEATSLALFSEDPAESEEYVMPYMATVVRNQSKVYITGWDGSGYNELVKVFTCSCGAPSTPTIEGTYYAVGPISEWYYMKSSNVWVRYAFQIKGNYFFHSVLFSNKGNKYPTSTSVKNLGRNVSHGCIRLAVDDIKWIYENCTKGMKVVIE